VYLDYVQNGHGRCWSRRSARGRAGRAGVDAAQVDRGDTELDIKKFTIKNRPDPVAKLEEDPLRPVLDLKPDLVTALERLNARLSDEG